MLKMVVQYGMVYAGSSMRRWFALFAIKSRCDWGWCQGVSHQDNIDEEGGEPRIHTPTRGNLPCQQMLDCTSVSYASITWLVLLPERHLCNNTAVRTIPAGGRVYSCRYPLCVVDLLLLRLTCWMMFFKDVLYAVNS
jgi:hypothetical protein